MYQITYIDGDDNIRTFNVCETQYKIMLQTGELDNLDSVTVKVLNV